MVKRAGIFSGTLSRAVMAVSPLWILAACAQMNVRSVSPEPNALAYELRGPDAVQLREQAAKLCPAGFDVRREAQQATTLAGSHFATRWWNKASAWLDDDEQQSQLAIVCKPFALQDESSR